jgi:hypothetical protein
MRSRSQASGRASSDSETSSSEYWSERFAAMKCGVFGFLAALACKDSSKLYREG